MWGVKEGWTAVKIGRALGVNEATIRRARSRLWQNPHLLLQLDLFEAIGRVTDEEYRCLVCGDQVIGRRVVQQHILRHFLDESTVQAALPPEKPQVKVSEIEGRAQEIEENGVGVPPDSDDVATRMPPNIEDSEQQATEPYSEEPVEVHDDIPSETPSATRSSQPETHELKAAEEPLEIHDDIPSETPSATRSSQPETHEPEAAQPSDSPLSRALSRIQQRRRELDQLMGHQQLTDETPPGAIQKPEENIQETDQPRPLTVEQRPAADTPPGAIQQPEENIQEPGQPRPLTVEHRPVAETPPGAIQQPEENIQETDQPRPLTGEQQLAAKTPLEVIQQPEEGAREPDQSQPPAVVQRIAVETPPGASQEADETSKRRDELERLVGEPVSFGPLEDTGEIEPDMAGWHEAFKRLSSHRGLPPPLKILENDTSDTSTEHKRLEELSAGQSEVLPAQEPAEKTPDSARRREEFERLRQQAADQNVVEHEAPQEKGVADTSTWHQAFERLAAQRGQVPPTQKPAEKTPDSARTEIEGLHRPQKPTERGAIELPPGPQEDLADHIPVSEESTSPYAKPSGVFEPSEDVKDATGSLVATTAQSDAGSGLNGRVEPREGHPVRALTHIPSVLSRTIDKVRSTTSRSSTLKAFANRGKKALSNLTNPEPKELTSVAIEHGAIKLLVSRGIEVLDYRIVDANPSLFREGLVNDAPRMASLIQRALKGMDGEHSRVIGAVPGYQTTLQRLELPNAKGMDPKIIIPREARRTMGISTENSYLAWHRMPMSTDMAIWLVISATNRSISSLSATIAGAGLRMVAMELRPFALARAVNQADAICAWAAADGCDAVVVRDWVPITHQAAYWGAGSMVEASDLVNRITEVVESTIATHDMQNPEMSVTDDIPMFVSGSPAAHEPSVAQRVAAGLRRPVAEIEPSLILPPGFPVDDMIVNIGLALWGA